MTKISNIGLGTAAIGRPLYINIKNTAQTGGVFNITEFKQEGMQVLESAYQKGIRYFDTAPGYGLSEQLLIEWLQEKNDPTIKIGTKWGYTYVANFDSNADVHEIKEHSLSKLNEQWEVSKQLLPYLSFYQIHSATLDTGVLENEKILNRLHEIKKKYSVQVGITASGANQLEILEKASAISIDNEILFSVYQCTFNMLEQSIRKVDQLFKNGTQLIIKEALANGRVFNNSNYPEYNSFYAYLEKLESELQVGRDAIILSYCSTIYPNAIVLSGANNETHLSSNLNAPKVKLTGTQIDELSKFKVAAEFYWNERKKLTWN
ncbi:Predicted oxidoreductase [Tenacibaculum sp. MAR_2009_124]|uniref:aldo/keto reductase n=1 Tax=Tenacibaculum sp. MAR_2009_124 TaxID=1250059 RepID=UPI00089D864B|nr:aldo/keto reductase [Tenacibaculum sp. MAR_2009_124]SED16126.1 Predicted oxidoreductase [Tenacibaculum sp. MAR_2009_124]